MSFLAQVALLGAGLTLCWAAVVPVHPAAIGGEMGHVAENLVRTGLFGNPFPVRKTGATAIVTPAYPFFLAGLLNVFGSFGGFAIILSAALAHGIHAALLIRFSRVLFNSNAPGTWAAILAVGLPTIRFVPCWEAIFAAAGTLAFCILFERWTLSDRGLVGKMVVGGLIAGFLALLNPITALVAVLWAGHMLLARWNDMQRPILLTACFAVSWLATPLPWMVRNQMALGAPVIKDGLGLNLFLSNNDCATGSFVPDLRSGCIARNTPYCNRAEADLLATMGEVKYDAYRFDTAKAWITANPKPFLRLTARRVFEFWFPNRAEAPYTATISFVTVLSMAGFVLIAKRNRVFFRFAVWVSMLYPVTYYVVFSDSRFRIPILWISLLGAGYFLQATWARCQSWRAAYQNRTGGAPARPFTV
ncbi:MAG: hypothetical protein LLG20_05920 [Acidobacteriales bacterium]|nr:hypothetical protein [Terriglobales bacterium]